MAAPKTEARMAALRASAKKAKIKAVVNLEGCTGCEACISACPVEGCIEKFGEPPTNNSGVFVNYDLCIGCKLCVKDCPWDTIAMTKSENVAGQITSLDTQASVDHEVFEHPQWVPERARGFTQNAGKNPLPPEI